VLRKLGFANSYHIYENETNNTKLLSLDRGKNFNNNNNGNYNKRSFLLHFADILRYILRCAIYTEVVLQSLDKNVYSMKT